MDIRRASDADFEAMWSIFQAAVATGDTYVFAPTTSRQECHAYWFGPGITTFAFSMAKGARGAVSRSDSREDVRPRLQHLGMPVADADREVVVAGRAQLPEALT